MDLARSPAPLQCPLSPPRGLHIDLLGEAAVAVRPGQDILLEVRQEQVSAARPCGALLGKPRVWVLPPPPVGRQPLPGPDLPSQKQRRVGCGWRETPPRTRAGAWNAPWCETTRPAGSNRVFKLISILV